jgi:tetratricopeptide (TPR) repeat protein
MAWALRKTGQAIKTATAEAGKATDLSFKVAEARARAIAQPGIKAQDEAFYRRMGDPLDDAFADAQELSRAGKHSEAADAFAAIIGRAEGRPIAAIAQLARGKALLAAGNGEGAASELEAFLEKHPHHEALAEAQVLRAEACCLAHRYSDALDAANRALAADEGGHLAVRIHLMRARAELALAQRDEARVDARFVKDRTSATEPSYQGAMEILATLGDTP